MSGFAHTSSPWTLGGKSCRSSLSSPHPTLEQPLANLVCQRRDRANPDKWRKRSGSPSSCVVRAFSAKSHGEMRLEDQTEMDPMRWKSLDQMNGFLDYELGARLCGLQPPRQLTSRPSPPPHRDPSRHDRPRHQHSLSQPLNMTPPHGANTIHARQLTPSPGVENWALHKHSKVPSQESGSRTRREQAHLARRQHEMQVEVNHHLRRASHEILDRPLVEKVNYRFDLVPEQEYYGGGVGTLRNIIPPLPPQDPLTSHHRAAYQLAHVFQTTPNFNSYDMHILPGAYPSTPPRETAPIYYAAGVESNLTGGVERIMHDGEPVDRGEFDGFNCTDRQYTEDGRRVVSNLGLVEGFSMAFKDEAEMINDALENMIANAKRQGANGVLGMQLDLADDGAVIARGQAVVLV
ncbi:BQ2448_78 [Microbotryum intermedium]|uniref:BQ2448_78 protein n=1 Tax=Microbotryum intermedium TaxID=269621 RepID=A0A238F4I3_9BASI|nr:BQ2448_78 [Microbotryum intermedium]